MSSLDWPEEIIAGNQAIGVFFIEFDICLLLIKCQYESYLVPLSISLSLPVGVAEQLVLSIWQD
jgi:HAE1 family hydrophobic/amphiphilic exporter-1